jgi:predicted porin
VPAPRATQGADDLASDITAPLAAMPLRGPIRAQVDWAKNKAQTVPTPAIGEITGLKIGLGWAYAPGSQISGIWGRLENDRSTVLGPSLNMEQTFWLLNWEHMLGQWQLLAQYYRADKIDLEGFGEQDETRVNGFTLAAKYFLSKRTGVYVSYSQAKNERAQFADFSGGGISSASAGGLTITSAGADVKIWALGVMHNF